MIPKASPDIAPSISEGENTPPPMRPAMVIAAAAAFTMVKMMASCSKSCPVSAALVVS
jgi:hypothetical protein